MLTSPPLSLCELVVGGKDGLQPIEKTVIDRCVRLVYRELALGLEGAKMPLLQDLYEELLKQPEPEAKRVATALELYCTGSLNLFNRPTNVDLSSRVVCIVLKGLGENLRKIAMHVTNEFVTSAVNTNYKNGAATWCYYYACKHRTMTRGHKCDYKKQINEELLDDAVAEVIVKLVSNPKFAAMMQEKINMKVDTAAIDQEIANYEKQLRQSYSVKAKLMEEIDSLDPDDRHYIKRKADLDDRLYKMYDRIEEIESQLITARAKKQAIEAEKLTGDNIYKVLIYFEKLYALMDEVERRQLIETLISEIQIYPERQPNGQWLKSIKFRLPIIERDMDLSLDSDDHMETVVQLSKGEIDSRKVRVEFSLEDMDMSGFQKGATYGEIKAYVLEKFGLKVSSLYISQVKRKCGLEVGENYNLAKSENAKVPTCPPEKEEAIRAALEHFRMI